MGAAAPAQPIFRPPFCGGGLHWAWVPYDPSVMQFGLTPTRAADRVRASRQAPSLQL